MTATVARLPTTSEIPVRREGAAESVASKEPSP